MVWFLSLQSKQPEPWTHANCCTHLILRWYPCGWYPCGLKASSEGKPSWTPICTGRVVLSGAVRGFFPRAVGANVITDMWRIQANACEQLVFVQWALGATPSCYLLFGLLSDVFKAQFQPATRCNEHSQHEGWSKESHKCAGWYPTGSVLCIAYEDIHICILIPQ